MRAHYETNTDRVLIRLGESSMFLSGLNGSVSNIFDNIAAPYSFTIFYISYVLSFTNNSCI